MRRKHPEIPNIDQYVLLLRNKGLKATPQRLAVHEAMIALGHASADMVCEWIAANSGQPISTASVYNILVQMTEINIYGRRMSPDNKMYFDIDPTRHVHLYDSKSGQYKDYIDPELSLMVEDHLKHRKIKGYRMEGVDIQIVVRPTRQLRPKTE